MFGLKNKKNRVCFILALISLAIYLIVFFASEDLNGTKEFSEYTAEEWSVVILPLVIMAVTAITSVVLLLVILLPYFMALPAINDYVLHKKFSEIDDNTEFLIFDFDEFKRACCRLDDNERMWFSIKEFNLKTRNWEILEEGRYVDNMTELTNVLQQDYGFDKIKYSHI